MILREWKPEVLSTSLLADKRWKELEEIRTDDPIGSRIKLTWAHTNDPDIKKSCQDGGVVTSILKYLLDTKQIDGAIVNIPQSDWNSFPVIITSSKQLLNAAGTRYSITPLLEAFQKPKIYSRCGRW